MRILIVDDEPANVSILGNLLENDYTVMVAMNGKIFDHLSGVSSQKGESK